MVRVDLMRRALFAVAVAASAVAASTTTMAGPRRPARDGPLWSPQLRLARASASGRFGVVRRRDGTTQLTAGARHLYTFVADSPGQVNGNGFQDQFGGRHFTWHAVLSSGAIALPAAQPTAKAPVQSTSRSYGSPY